MMRLKSAQVAGLSAMECSPEIFDYFTGGKPMLYVRVNNMIVTKPGDIEKALMQIDGKPVEHLVFGPV